MPTLQGKDGIFQNQKMILGAALSHQTLLSLSPSSASSFDGEGEGFFEGRKGGEKGGGEGEVVCFLLMGFHVVYLYKKKVKVVSRLREEVVFECSLTVCIYLDLCC